MPTPGRPASSGWATPSDIAPGRLLHESVFGVLTLISEVISVHPSPWSALHGNLVDEHAFALA